MNESQEVNDSLPSAMLSAENAQIDTPGQFAEGKYRRFSIGKVEMKILMVPGVETEELG